MERRQGAYPYNSDDSEKGSSPQCPCLNCSKYQGEHEDTGNGLYIVHCDDGRTRCVSHMGGCELYDDEFGDVKCVE
jgi:hypothetical protein